MEKPIKMDDLGVPLFLEIPTCPRCIQLTKDRRPIPGTNVTIPRTVSQPPVFRGKLSWLVNLPPPNVPPQK